MKSIRVLFIIKERKVYGTKTASYGLVNSCQFVVNALIKRGIDAKVVQVIDNNSIDREVNSYKPTHCFIEALWVVPSKFEELAKLHPTVKWNVRIHSMIPFLVGEGMAFDWINGYIKLKTDKNINISISCNNYKLYEDLGSAYASINYAPNIYNPENYKNTNEVIIEKGPRILNIGCFGALRVLKNHCQQAFYAMKFAKDLGKTLHFHINVSEHESNETSPVLKNLRSIFKDSNHKLIEHTWMVHEDFIELVKQMDFGLQLSFTETFNIVAADFVGNNIPVVVSNEINFITSLTKVDLSNKNEIMRAMYIAYYGKRFNIHKLNNMLLNTHNKQAEKAWADLLQKL